MRQLIQPIFIAASVFALSSTAMAQTAPIRMGQTTTQQAIQQTDQVLSRQTTRIAELEAQLQALTGKMENLEFQFGQAVRENESLQDENSKLFERLVRLEGKVEGLFQRPVTVPSTASTATRTPSASTPNRTVTTTTQSPTWSDDSSGRTRTVITSPNAGPTDLRGGPATTTTRSAPPPPQQTGSLGTLPASQLPGEAGALFELGKNRLSKFDHDGAEAAFRAFLEEFSDDPQAGEAYYWLGEALFQKGDYAASARFFRDMLRDYPDDPRRGEAVVKLARSLRSLEQTDQACTLLSRINDFAPNLKMSTKQRAAQEQKLSGCT